MLDLARDLAAQRLLLGPRGRIRQALGRPELVGRIAKRIETVAGAPLAPSQLVVTRVDRDTQQPAAKATGVAAKRLETTEGAQERVLGRVGGVLGVAER